MHLQPTLTPIVFKPANIRGALFTVGFSAFRYRLETFTCYRSEPACDNSIEFYTVMYGHTAWCARKYTASQPVMSTCVHTPAWCARAYTVRLDTRAYTEKEFAVYTTHSHKLEPGTHAHNSLLYGLISLNHVEIDVVWSL